ncbi:molybdopterin-dependent oxidoreductase [Methylovirgula sp. 4M-Z18]
MLERAVHPTLSFTLNGDAITLDTAPAKRLSKVLREECGLTGTKVGCDAGDCGACTVLINGEAICACLTAAGQAEGRTIVTVEGLKNNVPAAAGLADSFLRHGAAQCGICTPAMLMAASALLARVAEPDEAQVQEAIAGVLCRCTGYRKIIDAILDAGRSAAPQPVASGAAVGARVPRLDGQRKVGGTDLFGADDIPGDALLLRAIRSPHHRARFRFGDLERYAARHPGIVRIFTATDVPGENCYGVIPPLADQPVFAVHETRFRGEAVAAVVGQRESIEALDLADFPIAWEELPAHIATADAVAPDAALVHAHRAENILVRGRVVRGHVDEALAEADAIAEGEFETGFVEHAYIEPEAGFARRVGDRIEVQACTQSPYMDRDDIARILSLSPDAVRILPTAVGGGFGSKLDLSVQPFIAVAAWHLPYPVYMIYSRQESIMTTTKRHPSMMRARAGADKTGKLIGLDFHADFNTGAYASWGPTVANRVPVHASGPYYVPHYRALSRAVHTHLVPAGAFRGFGVPQASIAQEQLYDELAEKLGLDRLEFRITNALRADQPTVTGQVLGAGVGIRACFEALRPHWRRAHDHAKAFNTKTDGTRRRGVGVAGMWYGCGNTSLANPSTIRVALKADGRIALHQGAVDIGQGSNTVIPQICADALGAPLALFDLIGPDTDITPDAGKTSASRQTFVTGKAAQLAGLDLRQTIARLANAREDAHLSFQGDAIEVRDHDHVSTLQLDQLPRDERGYVLIGEATFDPPTSPLDADGQGDPYALYGFGAHMAEVEVDMELGRVRVLKITAAHDVGRAINPTLIEGQVEGGAAQGLGLALMEEFHPGRGESLHDYLIPTVGDMPPVETILIEDASPVGPFGAKGIGEQALIPTAPAILNGIYDAAGVRIRKVPATPDRVRAAIQKKEGRP